MRVQAAFDNDVFLAFQLIAFQAIIPFAVAYIATSSFLEGRLPQLLILGCATFAYGLFNLVVAMGVLLVNTSDWTNFIVTIHNSGVFVFSVITFLGSMVALYWGPSFSIGLRGGKTSVLALYSMAAVLVAAVGLLTLFEVVPPFVIGGEFTLLRQGILAATIIFLITSSVLLVLIFRESKLDIVYWYALGLAATGIGVISILVEPALGTPLSWTGRVAQYVGCGFLLVAASTKISPLGVVNSWAEAFKRDERQFNMLFANMKSGFAYHKMIFDAQGKPVDYVFLEVNDAFYEATGLGDRVVGKRVTEVIPGIANGSVDWIGIYGKVAATGEPVSFENFEPFTNRWYSISAYSPKKGYFAVLFEDITKRKKAEETMRDDEALLQSFFDSPGVMRGIVEVIADANVRHIRDNEATARYIGLASADLRGKLSSELGEPIERIKTWVEHYKQSQLSGQPIKFEYLDRQGSKESWLMATVTYMGTASTGYPRFAYVVVDDTEHKQLLDKLGEYAKNLEGLVDERTRKLGTSLLYARSLIEASLDPLVTINVDGKITDVNKATEQATGCSREQLIGSDFSDYFTEPEKARIGYMQVFTEGFVKDYALAIRHTSGKVTDVMYNAVVYKNEAGEVQGVFAAARDVTELKKAEAQAQETAKKLKDAERLAAIGATAGMVGHDIRNPLQAIIGDLFLARNDLASLPESAEKESLTESVDSIQTSVDYVNKIVQDLQDYARPIRPVVHDTDMDSLLKDVLKKNDIPKNVKVTRRITEQAKTLQVDPDLLERILGNLVNNAVQAMPEGGRLTIKATKKDGDVILTVKDTGAGIPEEAKPNLFTPLFTTKSKGQGFGLAVVKRMTEALNGTITFESEAGKGAEFILRIPQEQNKT